MPRKIAPVCDVDWSRLFSLPFGVPPSHVTAVERVAYAVSLNARATMPITTHGAYFSDPPMSEVRVAGPAAPFMVLPRFGRALVPSARETLTDAQLNSRRKLLGTSAFQPTTPAPGSVGAVDAALQDKALLDSRSVLFAPLAIPRLAADTVEVFFPTAQTWLPNTLTINQPGALDALGAPIATVPELLLATSKTVAGELDRLVLRAPVSGRYRFEPYYIYRRTATNSLEVVGPSASGRLVIEQPPLSTQQGIEQTFTSLFKERVFAFDHVDRLSVLEFTHAQLAFQLRHFEAMRTAHLGGSGTTARLAIPKSAPEIMDWVVAGVSRLLRGWSAFLSIVTLRWRSEDIAAAGQLQAAWANVLKKDQPKSADAAALLPIVATVLGTPGLMESLVFFLKNIYAPRLAGFSWTEVLGWNGRGASRFPVPSDLPPFNANDTASNAAKEQHQRLRQIEDPNQRWVACWAGAPIGKPAAVYAPAAAGASFPVNGVTTYELEALHAADLAHTPLGVAAPPAASKPSPGVVADLAAFAGKEVGCACWFTAGTIASNPLHSTADWLLELTQGIHFTRVEDPFIDLMSLVDTADATFAGHPLVVPLRTDLHEKAVRLRAQMDAAGMDSLATASLAWWDSKVGFAKVGTLWHHVLGGVSIDLPPSPSAPYKSERTTVADLVGVKSFDDLTLTAVPSGFDAFDIESAWLARDRVRVAPAPGLPLPVVLALMEREGLKQFAAINRRVRFTRNEGQTLVWEARRNDVTRAMYPPSNAQMSRIGWLAYPYGLDHYAQPNTDKGVDGGNVALAARKVGTSEGLSGALLAGVLALDPDESVGRYISTRVWATFVESPPIAPLGTPRIWKLHRRMHWAAISLMVAHFREMEAGIVNAEPEFVDGPPAPWVRNPAWATPPPDLTGKTPADAEWRDYLSYYGMIYIAYNGGPAVWRDTIRTAETAQAGNALQWRNFLLFRHRRDRFVIGNMVRFVIGLDAFLRLRYLDGVAPNAFAAANADTTAAAARTAAAWGV